MRLTDIQLSKLANTLVYVVPTDIQSSKLGNTIEYVVPTDIQTSKLAKAQQYVVPTDIQTSKLAKAQQYVVLTDQTRPQSKRQTALNLKHVTKWGFLTLTSYLSNKARNRGRKSLSRRDSPTFSG